MMNDTILIKSLCIPTLYSQDLFTFLIPRKELHGPDGDFDEHTDLPANSSSISSTATEYHTNGVLQDMSVTLERSRLYICNEIDVLTEMVKEREMELLKANVRQAEMEKMQGMLDEMGQRLKAMESV